MKMREKLAQVLRS